MIDSRMGPPLSIIMPVYNTEEKYIRPCLASIEACGAAGFHPEVVIVDDGSEPYYGTTLLRIVNQYDINARVFRKANGGQNSARAWGVTHATGEYLLFMDSDDRLVPSELARVLAEALKNRPGVLCFNYDRVAPDGTLISRCCPWRGSYRQSESLSRHIKESDSLWRQLYSRKHFVESGVRLVEGPRIGEDMASAVALLLAIGEVALTESAPYLYVQHPMSILHDVPEGCLLDILDAADGMLEQISSENRAEYAVELEALCILHVLFWGGVRAVKACPDPSKLKDAFFGWMDDRFPAWRCNACLGSLVQEYNLDFKLIVNGYWRLYAAFLKARALKNGRSTMASWNPAASVEESFHHEPLFRVRR
ncbi:glycosyltransferase family 2 protein [Adlercreutzia sp. ZJ141]|uniref:glycosyltransferase family 2 protein n=1 Tax=Adlercreutzia sp. ZJ141 TaxID=2709406 RepID=UPI0013ECCEB5|nr:glycosyltransferase family A protein [Adlercreutzia sp. ZJ141]